MSVDREVVRHVAALARLRLTEEQEATFTAQLGDIVGFVDILAGLPDAAGADSTPGVTPALRTDAVLTGDLAQELLAGAPDRDGDRLRVPAVLAQEAE